MIFQIKDILEDPIENEDSTDGSGDTIKEIFQPILDEFNDLIQENEGKKYIISGSIKTFIIVLSLRATNLLKILKIIRISTKIVCLMWPGQNQQ